MLAWKTAKRLVVFVVGMTVVLVGVALLVLPGPGMLGIALGLAILATEFVWARRLLKGVKDQARAAANSLRRGSRTPSPPPEESSFPAAQAGETPTALKAAETPAPPEAPLPEAGDEVLPDAGPDGGLVPGQVDSLEHPPPCPPDKP
jgi:hypothetical protein